MEKLSTLEHIFFNVYFNYLSTSILIVFSKGKTIINKFRCILKLMCNKIKHLQK